MTRKQLLGGVAVAAVLLGAQSADATGSEDRWFNDFYVSVFGGAVFPHDLNTDLTFNYIGGPTFPGFGSDVILDTGFTIGAAAGTEIYDNVRGEVEFAYAKVDVDKIVFTNTVGVGTNIPSSGDLQSYTVLANLWYDVALPLPITPFFGGGIGVGIVDVDAPRAGAPTFGPQDEDVGFAFQLGGGFKWAISSQLALEASYRFKGIVDLEFGQVGVGGGGSSVLEYENADLYTHNVVVGVTWILPPM